MTKILIVNDEAARLLADGENPLPEGDSTDNYDLVLTRNEAESMKKQNRFPEDAVVIEINPDVKMARVLIYFNTHQILIHQPYEFVAEKVIAGEPFEAEARAGLGSEEAPFRWDTTLINPAHVQFIVPFLG